MICFACGREVEEVPCPYCGFISEAGKEDYKCPNLDGEVCLITENICFQGYDFYECEVKAQAERESFF